MALNSVWPEGRALLNATAATADQEVVAAVDGRRIVVDHLIITNGTAIATVTFESGTSTAISPAFNIPVGGIMVSDGMGMSTVTGSALTVTTAGATAVTGIFVRYHLEG